MKKILYYISVTLLVAGNLFSCSSSHDDHGESDSVLKLNIRTRSGDDELVYKQDGTYTSLALYIFDYATGGCEYFGRFPYNDPALVPGNMVVDVIVRNSRKKIIAIANYDNGAEFSPALSQNLSPVQLREMVARLASPADNNIVMVCEADVDITGAVTIANMELERLAARIDVHVSKGGDLAASSVKVKSVKMLNRTLNGYCTYKGKGMPDNVTLGNAEVSLPGGGSVLQVLPGNYDFAPDKAHANFYSFQHIVKTGVADPKFPALEIIVEIDGIDYKYTGIITDDNQTTDKYNLLNNNVYTVSAILNTPYNLMLSVTVSPWEVVDSGMGYAPGPGDYSFGAFGNNQQALDGEVAWINDNVNIPACYSFELKAPDGAVWAASLSNGLDFRFDSKGSIPGKNAVSKGIARNGAYEIKVAPSKVWDGNQRETELYITVEGTELVINPKVSGGQYDGRKFKGSDTRILITQKDY